MHGSEKGRLWELSKRNKQWPAAFSVLFLSTPGLFPALRKTVEHSTPKIFLCAGSNPVVLKNSTEHAESLFIALGMLCDH